MNNEKLNRLVARYQATKSDATFTEIYTTVSAWWSNKKTIARSIRSNEHDVEALYTDTLMKAVERYDGSADFMNFYKRAVALERSNLYRKCHTKHKHEIFSQQIAGLDDGDDGNPNQLEALYGTTEQHPFKTKEADQRQLIDFLLEGADATTTAIVEAFLAHSKPNVTAIAKELGMHRQQIIRTLKRLAGKFDSKQHGDYRDYLVAL
jgi:DNA-binding phage protein